MCLETLTETLPGYNRCINPEIGSTSGSSAESIIIGGVLKSMKYWDSSSPWVWKTPDVCGEPSENKTSKYDYGFFFSIMLPDYKGLFKLLFNV